MRQLSLSTAKGCGSKQMPDPLFYGQTLLGTLLMGWLLVRIFALRGGDSLLGENTVAGVVGVTAAAVTGLAVLQIHFRLPPHNGLDRFLVIVLPMACGIELVASWWRLSRTTEIIVRGLASATCGGVLLYGSVHLQPLSIVWSVVSLLLCALDLVSSGNCCRNSVNAHGTLGCSLHCHLPCCVLAYSS